jgi:hypothetical protein
LVANALTNTLNDRLSLTPDFRRLKMTFAAAARADAAVPPPCTGIDTASKIYFRFSLWLR